MKDSKPTYEDLKKQINELKSELELYKKPRSQKYSTEIKATKAVLNNYLEDWRGLFEGMELGAALCEVITDENNKPINYRFIEINKRYTELTGLTREMTIGKTAFEINPDTEIYWIENLGEVAITCNPITYENFYEANNTYYSVYAYSPLKNYFAALVNDISKRKISENELKVAKAKAEKSDHLKSAFLANMSHEIRTPMNGILGFMSLLKEANLVETERDKYIKIINKSGNQLLTTINDIIEISRIESNDIEVFNEETEINEFVRYYYDFFLHEAKEKGLKLILIENAKCKNLKINADKNKLGSILTNLIKNAIKFTDKGQIEFGFDVKNNELTFFVKDTGVGINKDGISTIFTRFMQGELSTKKIKEGSGLGLAICKSYIKIMRGKIWVESKENIGSQFYFTLPLKTNKTQKVSVGKSLTSFEIQNKQRFKILIAEDDIVASEYLLAILDSAKYEILECRNGNKAVKLCENNPDIDIVLMDIKMPIMSGFEAVRKIRKFNKDIIIIAQTAYALIDDEQKALHAGCNAYISKPIKKERLIDLISKLMQK